MRSQSSSSSSSYCRIKNTIIPGLVFYTNCGRARRTRGYQIYYMKNHINLYLRACRSFINGLRLCLNKLTTHTYTRARIQSVLQYSFLRTEFSVVVYIFKNCGKLSRFYSYFKRPHAVHIWLKERPTSSIYYLPITFCFHSAAASQRQKKRFAFLSNQIVTEKLFLCQYAR